MGFAEGVFKENWFFSIIENEKNFKVLAAHGTKCRLARNFNHA